MRNLRNTSNGQRLLRNVASKKQRLTNAQYVNTQHSALGLKPENGVNLFITFKKNRTKYKQYE